MKYPLLFLLALLLAFSCNKTPQYAVAEIDKSLAVEFQRFDQDFYQLKNTGIENGRWMLQEKYGVFYKIYNQGVIKIGDAGDPSYERYATRFLSDSVFLEVYDTVQLYFPDMQPYELELTEAFQRYNSFFPDLPIPSFYTHISGFNEPIVVADSLLSVSLESYLGEDHDFYKRLGSYAYLLPSKNVERLPSDCVRAWLIAEFQTGKPRTNLLNTMINEGKLLYIHEQIMPDEPKCHLIGLTKENFMWCEKNELNLWKYIVENQHLFSTSQATISKYVQNGPFFNFFGSGTSPMVGRYIGWQIVSECMKNNPKMTLSDLLEQEDGQILLQESGYRP